MISHLHVALVALLLSACAERPAVPSPIVRTDHPASSRTTLPTAVGAATHRAPSHGSITSPLQISWVPVQFDARHAVLRARVEWHSRFELPLALRVIVPDGVRVARGTPTLTLPGVQQTPVSEYEYELTYERVPNADVLLTVDGDSASMGVHARSAFRFGRPEPLGPMPVPEGPPLVIGGRNFGRAIPASQ